MGARSVLEKAGYSSAVSQDQVALQGPHSRSWWRHRWRARSRHRFRHYHREAWRPVRRWNPCTTLKLYSDSALRMFVHMTGRHNLPRPEDSASEFSFRTTATEKSPSPRRLTKRHGGSLSLLDLEGFPFGRFVNDFAPDQGGEHFFFGDIDRLHFKKVFGKNNEISKFARLERAFGLFSSPSHRCAQGVPFDCVFETQTLLGDESSVGLA